MPGHYFDTILNKRNGEPVKGAQVRVYEADATIENDMITSGTLATIYSDNGVTLFDQTTGPLLTNDMGFFEFYTDESRVAIQMNAPGQQGRVIRDVDIVGDFSAELTALSIRIAAVEQTAGASNVVALAEVESAPDKALMFAGPYEMGVFDVSPAARDLLDDPDIETMRQTLGIDGGGGVGGALPYVVSGFFGATPSPGQVLTMHVFPADIDFGENWTRIRCTFGTLPSTNYSMPVRRDGDTIGAINISSDGLISFESYTEGPIIYYEGQVMQIVSPSEPDENIENVAYSIMGERI